MAHLWVHMAPDWTVVRLEAEAFVLTADSDPPVRLRGDERASKDAALLLRRDSPAGETWLLMAGDARTDIHVNGAPLRLGLRHLRDQDEIRLDGARLFFSTELLAGVVPFPGAEEKVLCPRCQQPIDKGAQAVRCPHCRVWHHQTADLPCWTYDRYCAGRCGHLTDFDAGFRWDPQEL